LSWWHHRIVAARCFTREQREELLDRAEREGLSTRALDAAVRDLREGGAGSRGATAEPPVVADAVISAARDLVRNARFAGAGLFEVPAQRVYRLRELLGEEVER
jgi:hypothetical protein